MHRNMSSHWFPGKKEQVADLSWWPKEGVFMGSSLWPGDWSHSCKDWFQWQYCSIIQQDKKHGIARTSNHWHNALKSEKRIKHLYIANTAASYIHLMQNGKSWLHNPFFSSLCRTGHFMYVYTLNIKYKFVPLLMMNDQSQQFFSSLISLGLRQALSRQLAGTQCLLSIVTCCRWSILLSMKTLL